jgi:hypothetical protein
MKNKTLAFALLLALSTLSAAASAADGAVIGPDKLGDKDRAALVSAIGERSYEALHPGHGILPSAGRLQLCLDALDRLDDSRGIPRGRDAGMSSRETTGERDPAAAASATTDTTNGRQQ